jgi:hypothetical protein
MINEKVAKEFVDRYEYVKNLYEVGPVQRCQILSLIDDIISRINVEFDSDDFQKFLVDNNYYTLYKQQPVEFVGMNFEEFRIYCEENGIKYRVSKRDGQYRVMTQDYNSDRANVHVEKDIVVKFNYG